eukprot:TRINITY_DN4385_c0_g1_i1.p1 TRINITY_DN4385_c0_g1~~TRINITY_DN4385_c0_g1_i1.p1  ORF type:complete len:266 (+),score=49.40 TRINITY_DN4385_c0_g1_i1:104-901(+)
MHAATVLAVFVCVVCCFTLGTCQIVKQKASDTGASTSQLRYHKMYNETYKTTGYLATVENPIKHFHIYYPVGKDGACAGRALTSAIAREKKCDWATNGGPFDFSAPTCRGYIISDGHIVLMQNRPGHASFGLTRDGYFVLGELSVKEATQLAFHELVTGFGWLVRDGEIVPPVGGEIAPRTSIGVDSKGVLMIFVADGVEKEFKGLTDYQAAEWFKALGVKNAISLDGGGSSTAIYKEKIVNVPTCNDTPQPCQRDVVTVTCIID